MYVIQRKDNVLAEYDLATSTSAALVMDSSTAAKTPVSAQAIVITNNDAAITLYFGYSSSVTSSSYSKKLAPGEQWEDLANRGVLSRLYCIAASGTPSIHVVVFG